MIYDSEPSCFVLPIIKHNINSYLFYAACRPLTTHWSMIQTSFEHSSLNEDHLLSGPAVLQRLEAGFHTDGLCGTGWKVRIPPQNMQCMFRSKKEPQEQ